MSTAFCRTSLALVTSAAVPAENAVSRFVFCEIYSDDKGCRIKESTWAFKNTIMRSKLIPYFGEMRLKDIAPHEMSYWTKEEYSRFARQMKQDPVYYCAFEMLYWTGMREGELLALTPADIDVVNKTVTVNKTYHRMGCKDIITSLKTAKSNRTISIPTFLCDELEAYIAKLKQCSENSTLAKGCLSSGDKCVISANVRKSIGEKGSMVYSAEGHSESSDWEHARLFTMSSYHLRKALAEGADLAGVKQIRVHDLRHSHVSLLINNGFSALAIGERVGHEAEKITYRYAHLFSSVQNQMADLLDAVHKN